MFLYVLTSYMAGGGGFTPHKTNIKIINRGVCVTVNRAEYKNNDIIIFSFSYLIIPFNVILFSTNLA